MPPAPTTTEVRARGRARRHVPSLVVLVLGLLVTAALTWTCWTANDRNETRLLHIQVQQARTVILAAVPDAEAPLLSAVDVATATDGDPGKFATDIAPYVGPGRTYASASLFSLSPTARRLALAGSPPLLGPGSPAVARALATAERTPNLVVIGLLGASERRLGYAFAGPGSSYAVYAETPLPPEEHLKVASNSAFSELDFALYLGHRPTSDELLGATDVAQLPLTGRTATAVVPFGTTALLLVARPAGHLGGTLLANLFWIVAAAGVVLTLVATWVAERLVRDRRLAEQLAVANRALYGQQRGIAQTLQRAFLPRDLPTVPGIEVAMRYLPGAEGIDVGGDWCDVVVLGPSEVLVVVGDVSGSGLPAATTMASLHYSIRAYARQGDAPADILTKLSRLVTVADDRQFASVLCGRVDVGERRVTVANAGHLPPLLVAGGRAEFAPCPPGPPIGVDQACRYVEGRVDVPPGGTLLAFTDGLVERRGEVIDVGLARLQEAAAAASGSLEETLDLLLDRLVADGARDDTAILGVRWTS